MKKTFKLEKGEIIFDEEKIIIKDDAKKQKWMWALILFSATGCSLLTFVGYFKTGNHFDFWYGLIICFLGILLFTNLLLKSVSSNISIKDVKSIKLKQRLNNKFLDIKLKNNRLRRVSNLGNAEELEVHIKNNFDIK